MIEEPFGKKKCIMLDERPYVMRVKDGKITSGEIKERIKLEKICQKTLAKYEKEE